MCFAPVRVVDRASKQHAFIGFGFRRAQLLCHCMMRAPELLPHLPCSAARASGVADTNRRVLKGWTCTCAGRERAHASDFTAALSDYQGYLRRAREAAAMQQAFAAAEAGQGGPDVPILDFSLKPGETLSLNLAAKVCLSCWAWLAGWSVPNTRAWFLVTCAALEHRLPAAAEGWRSRR